MRSAGWLSTTPQPFADLVLARCDLLRFEEATPLYHIGDSAGGIFGLVAGGLELHLPSGSATLDTRLHRWPRFLGRRRGRDTGQRSAHHARRPRFELGASTHSR